MYLFTIIPYLYFLKTRLKGKIQRCSWIFVYFIPTFVLFFFLSGLDNFKNIILLLISVILVNYIYENGYLQNDIKTTKKEKNPTLRLSNEYMFKIDLQWTRLILVRVLLSFIFLFIFFIVSDDINVTIRLFCILCLLQFLYLIYNRIRNIFNLILILPINYLRFYGALILFVSNDELFTFVVVTFFLYPFCKFLEFTNQPRYNLSCLSWLIGNVDLFRVRYYFILTIISLAIYSNVEGDLYFFVLSFYYFIFRLGSLLIIRKSKIVQSELDKNTKKVYRK